jgi:hypothetical protein
MNLAIMQPYFFPYIGYFQLIHSADMFVIYDDVNYIKRGWINRNRILLNGQAYLFTLNLSHASQFKLINEIEIGNNNQNLLKTIEQAYKKAPFFKETFSVIDEILNSKDINLSRFLENSIRKLSSFLGIRTNITVSSNVHKDINKKGQDKIIDICQRLGASTYINSIGGQNLYSRKAFAESQINLWFLRPRPIDYPQFKNDFVPWLSIIDVMMFNPRDVVGKYLDQYELI